MQFRNRQRARPKPKRLYSVGWLSDEMDRLTSLIVRALRPYCVLCHSVVNLECGHLLTRTWRPTRWDINAGENCATLCHNCNMRHEGEPKYYVSWYITEYSEEAYSELKFRAASHRKFTYADLMELMEGHKAVWERLKKAA